MRHSCCLRIVSDLVVVWFSCVGGVFVAWLGIGFGMFVVLLVAYSLFIVCCFGCCLFVAGLQFGGVLISDCFVCLFAVCLRFHSGVVVVCFRFAFGLFVVQS